MRLSRVETSGKGQPIVVIEYEERVGFFWWKKVVIREKRYLSYAKYPSGYAEKNNISCWQWLSLPEMLVVRGDFAFQLDALYREYAEL